MASVISVYGYQGDFAGVHVQAEVPESMLTDQSSVVDSRAPNEVFIFINSNPGLPPGARPEFYVNTIGNARPAAVGAVRSPKRGMYILTLQEVIPSYVPVEGVFVPKPNPDAWVKGPMLFYVVMTLGGAVPNVNVVTMVSANILNPAQVSQTIPLV